MARLFRRFLSICSAVLLCFPLIGCTSNTPDVASVEKHFQKNYDDICLIIDFMCGTSYDSIYIDGIDGTMLADLESVAITDESVLSAIKRLLSMPNRQYHSVSMRSNTIEILQWTRSMDLGGGVVYSINKTDIPYTQYCTELIPLSEPGWYYYVADYNAWRTGKRPSIEGHNTR